MIQKLTTFFVVFSFSNSLEMPKIDTFSTESNIVDL